MFVRSGREESERTAVWAGCSATERKKRMLAALGRTLDNTLALADRGGPLEGRRPGAGGAREREI